MNTMSPSGTRHLDVRIGSSSPEMLLSLSLRIQKSCYTPGIWFARKAALTAIGRL